MRIGIRLPEDNTFRQENAHSVSANDIVELKSSAIVSALLPLLSAIPIISYVSAPVGYGLIVVACLFPLVSFPLIGWGHYTLYLLYQTFLTNGYVAVLAFLFGGEANFQYNIIPLLCVSAINSAYLKKWVQMLNIGYPLCILFTIILFNIFHAPSLKISGDAMQWVRMVALANGIAGTLLIVVGFLINTHRKNHEIKQAHDALSTQNKELRRLNAELDSFVYSVSHDLRSPLSSLLGLIELMKKEENMDTIQMYLSMQEKSINKLDVFIQDIIHLSRNTRTEIKYDKADLESLVKDIFESLSHTENAHKIRFTHTISAGSQLAYTDIQRLNIILNNLIGNACRYADLSKPQPQVDVFSAVSSNKIEIRIKDNGIGIAPEHQSRVFEMFYRAVSQKNGSGLGLYIVRETVNKLNGQIAVRSELGSYTEFVLEIPNLSPIFAAQQSTTT